MYYDGKVWLGLTDEGEKAVLLPRMANRHGMIAGATGTGKTVTLKVMAEAFSSMGVPVFLADVKGDLAGTKNAGTDSEDMRARIERFGLADAGFSYQGFPVTYYDIFGKNGIQLRTTISEMGPTLLARILELNQLQTDVLSVVFKIADDNELLLIDTKDLKAMLNFVNDNRKEFQQDYGNIATASIGVILRAIVALESEGGDVFFGEPAINLHDWFTTGEGGKGMINVLDSQSLINNGKLYSTFLLWMLSELFENLPEVGDLSKPKMVFFFDEAHLLFKNTSKSLLEKIEQVVKLIRSKGVGVYFVTQNPRDIPDNILAQLGNKVQHGLHAYSPSEQKAVRAAAQAFRENPAFKTYDTILELGTGEAIVSFLDEGGIPTMVQKVKVLPPQSAFGGITDADRDDAIKSNVLYGKYAQPEDPDSAYEFLERRGLQQQKEAEEALAAALAEKERLKQEAANAKAAAAEEARLQREKEKEEAAKMRAAKQVGSSVAGTVGREVGKTFGSKFGTFGKTLGGNIGASLGRGILNTFFKS